MCARKESRKTKVLNLGSKNQKCEEWKRTRNGGRGKKKERTEVRRGSGEDLDPPAPAPASARTCLTTATGRGVAGAKHSKHSTADLLLRVTVAHSGCSHGVFSSPHSKSDDWVIWRDIYLPSVVLRDMIASLC
jgi:hypothetical protein